MLVVLLLLLLLLSLLFFFLLVIFLQLAYVNYARGKSSFIDHWKPLIQPNNNNNDINPGFSLQLFRVISFAILFRFIDIGLLIVRSLILFHSTDIINWLKSSWFAPWFSSATLFVLCFSICWVYITKMRSRARYLLACFFFYIPLAFRFLSFSSKSHDLAGTYFTKFPPQFFFLLFLHQPFVYVVSYSFFFYDFHLQRKY